MTGGTDTSLVGQRVRADRDPPFAGILRYWASHKPTRAALTFQDLTLTWADLYSRSARVAQGLIAAGLKPGDRVAYVGKNGSEFIEILFATSMAGGVVTAINWRLAPAELAGVLVDSTAVIAFVDRELIGLVPQLVEAAPLVAKVVIVGDDSGTGFAAWRERHAPVDPLVPVSDEDIALQVYTSGTTGLPKGAMLSNAALQATDAIADIAGITGDSVVLVSAPVFHAAGSTVAILAYSRGARCVITREAKPHELLEAMATNRVTLAMAVPAVLRTLVEIAAEGSYDLSGLDTILYSSSPISPELLRRCLEIFGCRFIQTYGMTETITATVLLPEDHLDPDRPELQRSCGRALAGVEVRTVDRDGIDVPDGEIGEVWIKAATNMSGYWHAPAETSATITADGFIRSGDVGVLRDGYLYLQDRIKDMIVTGGENVYPVEVENALTSHRRILDAAVIGVPSERWGETVKAVVVVDSATAPPTEDEIIEHCRARLAHSKCPTSVDVVTELPRNPSGKVLKRKLREPYWIGRSRRVS
jgi:long-chain acyl-CoA synthetase